MWLILLLKRFWFRARIKIWEAFPAQDWDSGGKVWNCIRNFIQVPFKIAFNISFKFHSRFQYFIQVPFKIVFEISFKFLFKIAFEISFKFHSRLHSKSHSSSIQHAFEISFKFHSRCIRNFIQAPYKMHSKFNSIKIIMIDPHLLPLPSLTWWLWKTWTMDKNRV